MEYLIEIIVSYAHHAHWVVFALVILAGFNLPFSIDLIALSSAVLAATIVPENTWFLFSSLLGGCYLSAMCAYGVGRFLGLKLQRRKFFSKFLQPERLSEIKRFYEKYGFLTLAIGRFIPLGVRNCLFMSAGMSKFPFKRFILMDAFACSLWCSSMFCLFYKLGQNYESVWQYLKTFHLLIVAAFSVTVISFIWYKSKKKKQTSNPSTN